MEAVCTNRALGDFPIKALPLDIGVRRPLGVGAGGLAILCAMPETEAHAIIQNNAHRYLKFATFSVDFLRQAVDQGRVQGYSFLDSAVTPGTAAIAATTPGTAVTEPAAVLASIKLLMKVLKRAMNAV